MKTREEILRVAAAIAPAIWSDESTSAGKSYKEIAEAIVKMAVAIVAEVSKRCEQ